MARQIRVRPILIDLDDTLLDDHGSTAVAFDAFVESHRALLTDREVPPLLVEWRRVFMKHWVRHERGEVSFQEQRRARVREFLGKNFTDDEADQALLPYLKAYEASWQLLPGVREFLERSAHIPKVILTNGDRQQQLRKVTAMGLLSHVAAVITPEDSGYWKPHHGMFLAGARCVGASPSTCIMVGDDPVRDIAPARELGMACFEVKRGRWHEAFEGALSAA
jgi:putative hydrolase of the HAD superfamily